MIDLRSDTVTLPSEAMMRAIASAKLGDDVYGEDPTVHALEGRAADVLGKEAALFVPTGTMGNLCAILTHGARGQRLVVGAESHVFLYEAGGASALGGLVLHPVANTTDGALSRAELSRALESPDDPHVAPAGILALENTHNRCGGTVLDATRIEDMTATARARSIPVHLDGARLFNAAIALGVPARTLTAAVDSVQICFSKGLGSPAGSVLAGSAPFVHRARRMRKMLGGGMRQAGILAAACLVALEENVARLADDHARARHLATEIRDAGGAELQVDEPRTNIVIVRARDDAARLQTLVRALRTEGVLVGMIAEDRLRAVTHLGIDDRQLERAIVAFRRALGTARGPGTTSADASSGEGAGLGHECARQCAADVDRSDGDDA